MKTVDLPPITQADAEAEHDRLFDTPAPPPPYPAIQLETVINYEGYSIRVVFRDTSLADAVNVLRKRGCAPAQSTNGAVVQPHNTHPASAEQPPTCPSHNRPMKPMKFADKQGHMWMCTTKVGDGWCAERA
jgi:hypothetical protein